MSHIDLRAETPLPYNSPIEDPLLTDFLMKMKTMAYLTATFGEIFSNNEPNLIDWKSILTTEHLDPTNFVATELTVYGTNRDFHRGAFSIYRCLPSQTDTAIPYERAASIELDSSGTVGIRTMPPFYPESALFEAPSLDGRFTQPRQITKETFLGKTLVRGPLSSLGPNTKQAIYRITNEIYGQLISS